jgi:hypothetical protein
VVFFAEDPAIWRKKPVTWIDGSGGETLSFALSRDKQTVHVPEQLLKRPEK